MWGCFWASPNWFEHWALGLAQIGYWVLGPTTKKDKVIIKIITKHDRNTIK